MSPEILETIDLIKWPAMVVKGKSVTKEQAAEIIVRTDGCHFSSNDHDFCRQLNELYFDLKINENDSYFDKFNNAVAKKLNRKPKELKWNEICDYKSQYYEKYKRLDLVELQNGRITSSFIGGAYGWIDWEGNIGCNNYNIGKWPNVEDVFMDWSLIAETFPYLDLTCQLMNHEAGFSDSVQNPKAVIEFKIKDGNCSFSIPTESYKTEQIEIDYKGFFGSDRERGCTIEQFQMALNLIAK